MKICTACGNDKPIDEFARNKRSKDGLTSQCADCRKRYRDSNKDRRKLLHRQWLDNNKDKKRQHYRNWYAKNKERQASEWQNRKIDPVSRARRLINLARSRAKKSKLEFDISVEWLLPKLELGTCEVTGIQFTLLCHGNGPFMPSLDRKDPKIGYTKNNTQLVVFSYNCAKGNWSHNDVIIMAKELIRRSQCNELA